MTMATTPIQYLITPFGVVTPKLRTAGLHAYTSVKHSRLHLYLNPYWVETSLEKVYIHFRNLFGFINKF